MSVTIGVDIGGTKIAAGIVAEDGEVLGVGRRSTPKRDADAVVDVISELVTSLVRGSDEAIAGVGLGVAGFVDATQSVVLTAPNLGWSAEPIKAKLEESLTMPVVVENDANAAAWGEFRFGAGSGRTDMVMVTVGTGVGGGIVMADRLVRGHNGVGAEFGHLVMVPDGRQCGCGRLGCWEQYASGSSLVRYARELAAQDRAEAQIMLSLGDGTPEGIQGLHVTEAAQQGDAVALEAFDLLGQWLGRGMADVAALLDPEVFVIGGGVVESGDLVMRPTKNSFAESLVAREVRPLTPILAALLGNAAGIVGAADLARPEYRS
jgi:glucokinase